MDDAHWEVEALKVSQFEAITSMGSEPGGQCLLVDAGRDGEGANYAEEPVARLPIGATLSSPCCGCSTGFAVAVRQAFNVLQNMFKPGVDMSVLSRPLKAISPHGKCTKSYPQPGLNSQNLAPERRQRAGSDTLHSIVTTCNLVSFICMMC